MQKKNFRTIGLFSGILYSSFLLICSKCSMTLQLWRSSSIIQTDRQTDKTHGKTTITLCLRTQVNKDNSLTIKHESNVGKKENIIKNYHLVSVSDCVILENTGYFYLIHWTQEALKGKMSIILVQKLMQVEIWHFIEEYSKQNY